MNRSRSRRNPPATKGSISRLNRRIDDLAESLARIEQALNIPPQEVQKEDAQGGEQKPSASDLLRHMTERII